MTNPSSFTSPPTDDREIEGTVPSQWYIDLLADRRRLAAVLREARPYVYGATCSDQPWRRETAQEILERIDGLIAALPAVMDAGRQA